MKKNHSQNTTIPVLPLFGFLMIPYYVWVNEMVTESCVWIYRSVATQRVVRYKASKTPPTTVLFRRTFQILSCILYDSHLAELFPSSFSLIVKYSSLLHVKKHEMCKAKKGFVVQIYYN